MSSPAPAIKNWIMIESIGPGSKVKCLRCGAVLGIALPCVVDDWCAAVKSFYDRHIRCEPREQVNHEQT